MYMIIATMSIAMLGCQSCSSSSPIEYNETVPIVRIFSANGRGTGTVIGKHLILTANHIVYDKMSNIELSECDIYMPRFIGDISLNEFAIKYKGKVIFRDKKRDLALIQIEETFKHIVKIASNEADLGDQVYQASFKDDGVFITSGNVVAKTYPVDYSTSTHRILKHTEFTTDVTVLHGSSGGMFVNKHGKLVGIIQSMYKANHNLSTSISLEEIKKFLNYAGYGRLSK